MTSDSEIRKLCEELVKAAVELAIVRHDLCRDDNDMDVSAIAEDVANAVIGAETCAEEPIPEYTKLVAALRAKIEAERWIPVSEKPERAGWYNVLRITDGHRSVRCWDDSIEAWMYVGEGPGGSHFVPNNSFTHWRPLPSAPEVKA